jgi:RNA polymerase sigma-70 factor (ECF subfamily)
MENARDMIGAFAARRLPDDNLFERAVRGDATAFSEVYRRYEKRVYGFCLARSLDPEAAADATQEVFMRLLKAAPGSVEHPRAWLFAVARNVSIDAIRKRARLSEVGEVDERSPAWESMAAADTADEVSSRSDSRAVFLALRRMKPRYRTALILREIHGQSSSDIAEAMAVKSAGAVDTLVSRARDAFGVAYATISELSPACRANVELIYRSRGTGISEQQRASLTAHLASCERCRAEDARAGDPNRLSGLLPLLVPAGGAARSLLGRAALASHTLPDMTVTQQIAQFLQTHVQTVGSRVAAGVLAATLVAAPIVAVTTASRHATTTSASATSRVEVPPAATFAMTPSAGHSGVNPRGAAAGVSAHAAGMRGRGSSGPVPTMKAAAHTSARASGSPMRGAAGTGSAPRTAGMSSPTPKPKSGMPHRSGM